MTDRTWLTALFLAACVGGCGSDDSGSDSKGGGGGHGSVTSLGGAAGAGSGGSSGAAGGGAGGDESCPRFVKSSPSHQFGPGQSAGQLQFPAPILGPPRGAGSSQGSLDVVALGNGGQVTLAFGQTRIVDGPGPDFIVFENAFFAGGIPNRSSPSWPRSRSAPTVRAGRRFRVPPARRPMGRARAGIRSMPMPPRTLSTRSTPRWPEATPTIWPRSAWPRPASFASPIAPISRA